MQQQLRRTTWAQIVLLTDMELVAVSRSTRVLFKTPVPHPGGQHVPNVYFVVVGLLKLVHRRCGQHLPRLRWKTGGGTDFRPTTPTLSLAAWSGDTTVWCLAWKITTSLRRRAPSDDALLPRKKSTPAIAAQQRLLSLLTTSAKERTNSSLPNPAGASFQNPAGFLPGVSRENPEFV
jgi:hypothetical protein